MPQLATTLNDSLPTTQAPLCSTTTPPTSASSSASPTGKFRYISDDWAIDRLNAVKRERGRTLRGSPLRALALYVKLRKRADRNGHVRTSNEQLARAINVRDRHTVLAAAHLLVAAGLIDLPVRTYNRRGYVNGLEYTVRFDPAYGANERQQDLPLLRSRSTKSSSALRAPRPAQTEPATNEQVRTTVWDIVNFMDNNPEAASLKPLGIDTAPPGNLPDLAIAITALLTVRHWRATEADIRDAIDHVERQHWRTKQMPLPLIGVARPTRQLQATLSRQARAARDEVRRAAWYRRLGVLDPVQAVPAATPQTPPLSRQMAARTTIGGAGQRSSGRATRRQRATTRSGAAFWAVATVVAEERDRRRVVAEQLRTDVVAAVAAQPPDVAAALREAVRPELDALLQRCPGLTDRNRPAQEHHAIVALVLRSLAGRSIADTIAALVEEERSGAAAYSRCRAGSRS